MKYLKIWTNFQELMETLKDDEKGRLFCMMLHYADSKNEPETFIGNERFLWPVAKQHIDLAAQKNEILRKNGMKGGRPKADETKQNQTEPNETKENQTKAYKRKEKKRNVNEKKDIALGGFELFWSAYPKKVAKQDAVKAWAKIQGVEFPTIMDGLRRWKNSDEWSRDDGRYIPHPATWLNGRRWEDEVTPCRSGGFQQRDYSDVPGQEMDALATEMEEFLSSEKAGTG